MPVNTSFVLTTLKQCLEHAVEIQRLFDFLEQITSSNLSQERALSDFMEKWKPRLNKSSQKVMLVSYTGTWNPKCIPEKIRSTQESWNNFALKYDSTFTECTVNSQTSPDYQPLNFKELIRLTFWKEMYEIFGNQILTYIFDKCALLYEVDEGLYLLVGYSRGSISKRLWKYDGKNLKKGTGSCSTQLELPSKRKNPYQLSLSCQSKNCNEIVIGKENCKSLASSSDNRAHKPQQRVVVKRTRVDSVVEDNNGIREAPLKQIKLDRTNTRNNEANAAVVICENRWISPKPEVLEKLIDLRNSTKLSLNILTSNATSATTASNQTNNNQVLKYVCIQSDLVFKPKDKLFVLKQKASTSAANPKLPNDWVGLKLPKNLHSLSDSKGRLHIEVYVISELLARKLEIRLKPKGRQRKKKISLNLQSSSSSATTTGINLIAEHLEKTDINNRCKKNKDKGKVMPTFSAQRFKNMQNVNNSAQQQHLTAATTTRNDFDIQQIGVNERTLEIDRRLSTMEPYCLTHTLPISACLYNKASWSKWPTSHCLSKAVLCLKQKDNVASISLVLNDILKLGICKEAVHQHLLQSLNRWKFFDNSNPLNKIVLNILQCHAKFNDIHKLFKNCVSYWRSKYLLKQERNGLVPEVVKAISPPVAHNAPVAEKVDGEKRVSETEMEKEPEVVNLTQSTSSTHYTTANNSLSPPPVNEYIGCAQQCSSKQVFCRNETITQTSSKDEAASRKKYELLRKWSGNSLKKRSFKSLKYPVPHNCIMQSLKQIFHIMKVDQLLGSKRNVRGFFKFVRKALILGGTKSSLHLSELMALLHPSDMPILHVTKNKLAVETFTAKVVTWLFNEYVLVLLKTCFYITESNFSRLQVKFYLRESWISASTRMKTHLVERGALDVVRNNSDVRPNAILRYVPKQNHSLRSLLVTKKSAWGLTKEESKQFNMYLHYIDAKINKSRMYLPTTIQYEWRKFISEWKANDSPKLYYLRMDIRDAYPSVSLSKLNEILLTAGGERGRNMVIKKYALFGSNGRKRFRESLFDTQSRNNWHSGIHVRPCIAIDIERDIEINVWNMLERITKIITTTNIVKLGKKSYQFYYGLPQGWSQSPILCSIYYGYIDSTLYFPYIESKGRLFLRVVDDYLFITPSPTEILNLTQLMKIGCEKYGIKMNDEKLINNIFVRSDTETPNINCEQVTFCGWNFCVTCGHVSRDFKKYVGQDFCSTITFQIPCNMTSPEEFIRLRGTLVVPARVKPILLDPAINCYKRILVTVFEASIVLGFRFYAICRVLYPNLNVLKEDDRVKILISSIHLCCTRLAKLVTRNAEHYGPTFSTQEKASCSNNDCCGNELAKRTTSSSNDNTPNSFRNALSVDSVKYTSLIGFRVKLLNHSGVFEKLLPVLNRSIAKIGSKLGDNHCDNVIKIVGSKMPDCLSEIRI